MPPLCSGPKSSESASSTICDWLPGTSNPPPIRSSVCFAASGAARTSTAIHAARTSQRRRVRNSDRLIMKRFKRGLPETGWLARWTYRQYVGCRAVRL
jgi:hypothetical protein